MARRSSLALAVVSSGLAMSLPAASQTAGAPAVTPPTSADSAKPDIVVNGGTEQIVVSGVAVSKSVLPTIINSTSVYGLDLNVMETPRNNTILTHAQLDAVNLQDPHAFS